MRTKSSATKAPVRDVFTTICKTDIGVDCVKEYKFHPVRKWRFDYCIKSLKIAIEVDGGVWINGRHNRASGYLKDLEKFNAAASMGWVVLKFTPDDMYKTKTLNVIRETVKNRKESIKS
ncbi:MAG: endonuclease domain-containing protein [Mediterranea sp.]|jgi:very-short-patch-repair endonuclease|nr:endonuclease domain-containing protein [Mediterranea sp.]